MFIHKGTTPAGRLATAVRAALAAMMLTQPAVALTAQADASSAQAAQQKNFNIAAQPLQTPCCASPSRPICRYFSTR